MVPLQQKECTNQLFTNSALLLTNSAPRQGCYEQSCTPKNSSIPVYLFHRHTVVLFYFSVLKLLSLQHEKKM